MKVKIPDQCDRCKRQSEREVDTSELAAIEEAQNNAAAKTEELKKFLSEQPKAAMPDLIVYFKGEVHMTNTICDKYCAKTVKNQMDGMFKVIDPTKKRGPRKDKAPKAPPKDAPKDKKAPAGGKSNKSK
jgi:hypothetical protein